MDKRFIDSTIHHIQYGRGVIINIINDDITVTFGKQDMLFKFPDAFEDGTLFATDSNLRSYVQHFIARVPPATIPRKELRFGVIPIVFLNIAWMKWYDGVKNDIPVNGGKYISEHQYGCEVNNFTPHYDKYPETDTISQWVIGSYTTKSTNGNPNQTRIERIAGCQDLAREDSAEGVLVIWCATSPELGRRVVGWYKDATVFRNYESQIVEEDDGTISELWLNVCARAEDAVLLGVKERGDKKWSVPGHTRKDDTNYGFGQSSIWYASEPSAEEYVKQLVKSINEYTGPKLLEVYNRRKGIKT